MSIPDFANEPIVKPASSSQLEDMVTVIPSPSTVFEHRRDGKFGLALLVLTAITAVIAFLSKAAMSPIMDAEFARNAKAMIAKNPQMTVEMMEKGRAFTEKFLWVIATLGMPLSILIVGVMLWLLGKVVGSKQTAAQGIAVATFAYVPRILQYIANWAQLLVLDPDSLNGAQRLSVGPARFLDPDVASPIAVALAGRFDLFVLWSTVLLAIGLSITGHVTRKQGAVGAFLVWLLASAFALMGAIRNMA